ncbi:MAG: GGDEF domain-containing phosphodiesterase [Clostridium sp.]|uniref:EAL domain-containing protein n=1 Tax=Clostridium sp. TaxID=1506 RepID=UPI002FC9031F
MKIPYKQKHLYLRLLLTLGIIGLIFLSILTAALFADHLIYINSSQNSSLELLILFFSIVLTFIILLLIDNLRLKKSLYTDSLTNLPNRIFIERSIKSLKSSANSYIIFIDFDNSDCLYKILIREDINEIIKSFSNTLFQKVKPYGHVTGRIEKTKFCILVKNLSYRDLLHFADYIFKNLNNHQINYKNENYDININIGISHIKENQTPLYSFSHAEMALTKARENYKKKIVYLSPEDIEKNICEIHKMSRVNTSIKKALKENRFMLYLQPILNVNSSSISHYEGLIRMIDETGAFISPGEFISVAEKYGLIPYIDKWVFDRAITFLKDRPTIKIFINFSAVTLNNNEILKYFEDVLIDLRLQKIPINLGIEITETAAIENLEPVKKWMEIFKTLGCTIALDDFGVGYTSLSYLGSLPIDFVKIDGCFIKKITEDEGQESIVKAIKMVSEKYNKKTVGEFVEDKQILNKLHELKIDFAQGYYIGKPFPSLDIDKQVYNF